MFRIAILTSLTIGTVLAASLLFIPRSADAPANQTATVPTPCTDRVFLAKQGSYSWGSLTRWRGGYVTAHHVINSGAIQSGPDARAVLNLAETDFSFLSGAPTEAAPDSVSELSGRVSLEGFPARSTHRESVMGDVYAPDGTPPGIWITLDHPEPLVGGFSGGCVRNSDGEVVAIIMGASSMTLNGQPRHFARVIPIRAALAETQGQTHASPPVAFMSKPLPSLAPWPEQTGNMP